MMIVSCKLLVMFFYISLLNMVKSPFMLNSMRIPKDYIDHPGSILDELISLDSLEFIFLSILLPLFRLSCHLMLLSTPCPDYDILINDDKSHDTEVIEFHIEEPTTFSDQISFHDVHDHPLS